jgi:sulfur carrier protein ThiS adenylyltransferase
MTIEAFEADIIKKVGEKNFIKIQKTRVGIAGAGGLGSNCAWNLVRAGFKKFRIADFDTVDAANLDRQFYFLDQIGMDKVDALKRNLLRINPSLEIDTVKTKIEAANIKELFAGCDIVAECLDAASAKKVLVEELLRMKKTVVAASGLGGIGSSDGIKTHRVKDNLVIIGDLESDICRHPALSPRVNVAAAKQADAILEYATK